MKHGTIEGEIKSFNSHGSLIRLYHTKDRVQHGEEIVYYETPSFLPSTLTPKLSINWYEGKIQGLTKTWYPDGKKESQREMSSNEKHGLLMAWYQNGNLMMVEEYDRDKLTRGEYFKKGDKFPATQINEGEGTATMFDPEGNFVRKITYSQGRPIK